MQVIFSSLAECRGRLAEHGIKPSYQRMLIYQELLGRVDHPTAEQLHSGLRGRIPTLSLLSEKGLVRTPPLGDGECRYDGNTAFHGHRRCLGCGTVEDFACGEPAYPRASGFTVARAELVLEGYCGQCRPGDG